MAVQVFLRKKLRFSLSYLVYVFLLSRPVQKQLPGGLRQLTAGHVRQWDGHALPDGASHSSGSRQPDSGPAQHELAGRERAEPGGVAFPQRASQRKGHRVRTQAEGMFAPTWKCAA